MFHHPGDGKVDGQDEEVEVGGQHGSAVAADQRLSVYSLTLAALG